MRAIAATTFPDRSSSTSLRYQAAAAPLVLILTYVIAVAIVGMSGNFPLNDDWAYALTTRSFASTGSYEPSSWSSIPLVFQVLVATPFCLASQCDAESLRYVTQASSVILFATTFVLLRSRTQDTLSATMAAALVAFNPIVFALSFTFMSDVLFAALLTASALALIAALERDARGERNAGLVLVGTLAALAATMTRQLGLCLPLAFLFVRLILSAQSGRLRARLVSSLLPLLVCGAGLVALKTWLEMSGRLPALYDAKTSILVTTLGSATATARRVGHNVSTIFLYLGLFTLPLQILSAARRRAPARTGVAALLIPLAVTLIAFADLWSLHRLMPSGGNILLSQGIGPMLLRDVAVLGLPNVPQLPRFFWLVVTALSLLGTFLLARRMSLAVLAMAPQIRQRRLAGSEVGQLFAVACILAYFAPLCLISFYDRYLIPVLPLMLYLSVADGPRIMIGRSRRWRPIAGSALGVAMALFSILAAHDYMAWNRARWTAIAETEASRGVDATRIDGGMEYNGLRSYRSDYAKSDAKSWWWIDKDDFQVTFGPIAGLSLVKSYPYTTFLPPGRRSISVLEKDGR